MPGQSDVLKQPFLIRPESNFDWAKQGHRPRGVCRSLLAELFWVVGHKVASLPVRLKYGADLGDGIRITGRRQSHIPFETGHLGGVREVRRPDIRGGVPAAAMEHPGFRMEPVLGRVVGDTDFSTCIDKGVECLLFRAVCIGRSEQPNALPPLAMPPDLSDEGADATPPHERHDDIDRVRRGDLGLDLVANARLARCIRENRCVDQRCKWSRDRFRGTIRQSPQDCRKHRRGLDE